jgi:large subunit ribosomal protein L18
MKKLYKGRAVRNVKTLARLRRHARVRGKVAGTAERPRLAVWKSSTAIYAQLIDDSAQKTLAQANAREVKEKTPLERAAAVGRLIAERAKAKKVSAVVYDRGGFRYAGHVKALADAAREAGLQF